MERARDLLVEQRVLHRMQNVRIVAERPLAEIARAFIGVQNLVELGRVRSGFSLDDLAFLHRQLDLLKLDALVQRHAVVSNHAFHALSDRCGVAFAVRDVALAVATDRADACDREG